ncbi:MAG: hypothetical protein JWQ00_450, partial [Noviherbaspirillum sp.]|nr:hypothetical protein [Noviherbaspirillum sp.]
MFGVSATAFSFKQIFKGLRSNTGTGHLGLFKKHAARMPFVTSSMQSRSRLYSIRADENRLAVGFTFASRYCFSTGHAGGKSKDSLMLILRPNENLEAAREYETLRTFFVSKEAFVPSLDDLRTGLKYLACFDTGPQWESAVGSALERRQFAFDALVKSMDDKDSEQRFAIMKEE